MAHSWVQCNQCSPYQEVTGKMWPDPIITCHKKINECMDLLKYTQLFFLCSLRSKRFQSSYCAKVRAEAKKRFFVFLLLSQLSRRTSRGNACYAGYFLCAMHFGKRTLKTLLKSVVLISCEKVTTADLGKVGLVFRKWHFRELSS